MLIFNTTFLVSDKVHGPWLKWVREQHIPFMLESEMFSNPQVAKVLSNEDQDGTSYSVQFHVSDMKTLEDWHMLHATTFQRNFSGKFGTDAIFFATVLELVE